LQAMDGAAAPVDTSDDGRWVASYLAQSRDFADLFSERKLNGPLNDNIRWLAEHAERSSRPDRLISDLLSTPAAQLAGDLSRTGHQRLREIFEEKYA